MRFDEIKNFSIDELGLDEGNYRFRIANDQRQCIEKIYSANNLNFKNMMTSIAEDDLGEPLLVYVDDNGNHIVSDGNRRVAALKVLHNPNLANNSLIAHAEKLIEKHSFNFDKVQAQVSHNKSLILKTVYERHAAGKGKSRMDWPALARARFGYDNQTATDTDWKVIALIYEIERTDSSFEDFFDSTDYKHDVFSRIIPAAIKGGIIPKEVFSQKKVKKVNTSKKKKLEVTLTTCKKILNDIKQGVIGLSRDKGIYASADGVSKYLERFQTQSDEIASSPEDTDVDTIHEGVKTGTGSQSFFNGGEEHASNSPSGTTTPQGGGNESLHPMPVSTTKLSRNRKILIDKPAITRVQRKYKKSYAIYAELCELSSDKTPVACVAILRIFLETTLKKTCAIMSDCDWKYNSALSKKAQHIAQLLKESDYLTEGNFILVNSYTNTKSSGLFSVDSIQSHIHGIENTYPEKTLVNKYWDDLDPFIAACWKYIDEHDQD